ncbi:carbohydrate ABC transporter permease [Streptomyces justiciae]|uniref:Sugar ABC transporter permease n=1 Tax=Streptomyces justiciae TaxID=2780140 RepID=A0ABU3M247_9ACTN|nr:sugar ABC transporter permease [Streptomyces justiciae]MDT7845579.1 sugar ABC transporter permease [Streptomyces justiciae]
MTSLRHISPAAPAVRPPRERRIAGRSPLHPRRRAYHYAFALPSICLVFVFFVLPFVANAFFAFMQWTGYSATLTWTGLSNFELLDQVGLLKHAIAVTAVYAVVAMAVQNGVGLALAGALQRTNRVNSVFRSVFFVPVLISPLAAGYIWAAALDAHGPVNGFLSTVLPGDFHYAWLGHDTSALLTVASIDAWKLSGLITLVYIAGLNRIPEQILQAATLDGASAWRRFWAIKLPLLAPAITFNVTVSLVGAFSALDVVFSTTAGGPGDATTLLNVAVYTQYGQSFFGTASALSFVVTLMVLLTAVPLMGWLRRREVSM